MPTWGWFVIAVGNVYIAVLVSSRSCRGGSHAPPDLHPASTWRHLDDTTRDEVTCLLDRGRTTEAIKLLVARDGIGVRHAKATVEYGRSIAAISLLRDSTGMTLREAKDAVDQL
ncbi:hypothetical protein [Rhodococcus wratislaviensis]|uniref:hypothetical protein n=1 Tax=Rhodococcus wratislaviensis TaxID=44752 RepID=UPI000F577692|nr:hypothetical protein [Rhodococcus wratislaviensis]